MKSHLSLPDVSEMWDSVGLPLHGQYSEPISAPPPHALVRAWVPTFPQLHEHSDQPPHSAQPAMEIIVNFMMNIFGTYGMEE